MGWNITTVQKKDSILFQGIPEKVYFYYIHSYYIRSPLYETATSYYAVEFTSAIEKENLFGVQFHPEKSQKWGLKVLENFLRSL